MATRKKFLKAENPGSSITGRIEELGANKATKERFFILDDKEPSRIEDKTLIIRFQYRELTREEFSGYELKERGESNTAKQEKN